MEEQNLIEQRQQRMKDLHHTDIQRWRCQCAAFNHSPYHICTHLLRAYNRPYPLKGESVRQHAPPLFWIKGLQDESQRFQRPPPCQPQRVEPPVTLEELGFTQETLVAMSEGVNGIEDDGFDDYREEDSRFEEKNLSRVDRRIGERVRESASLCHRRDARSREIS